MLARIILLHILSGILVLIFLIISQSAAAHPTDFDNFIMDYSREIQASSLELANINYDSTTNILTIQNVSSNTTDNKQIPLDEVQEDNLRHFITARRLFNSNFQDPFCEGFGCVTSKLEIKTDNNHSAINEWTSFSQISLSNLNRFDGYIEDLTNHTSNR